MAQTHISINQAADRAGVHPRTVRRWIATGALPAYKMGPKLVRIDVADLDAFFRSHEATAAAGAR